MTKKIAVIFHQHERRSALPRFAVWHLAEAWKKEKITVHYLFGVKEYVEADLALLHVDLTEVPREYLEFGQRYPVVLNGRIHGIRKSSFSRQTVSPGDGYRGRVIVKSDLNYGGEPERKLLGTWFSRTALRISSRLPFLRLPGRSHKPEFRSPRDYRIYDSVDCIPEDWFQDKELLIEKFLPETDAGLYCLRSYHFLGREGACVLRKSAHPIVGASTSISREEVDPDPEIVQLARSMQFDFGKFDYVIHENRPILLDTNKTPGSGAAPAFFAMCRRWAEGIQQYL